MSFRNASPVVLALLLAVTACASTGTADDEQPPAGDATIIQVNHDVPAATSLTVTLVTPQGTQRRLGTVSAGARERFQFRGPLGPGDYRLVARLTDGRTYTSRPFPLRAREGVEWSPADNILVPIRRR